MTRNWVFLIGNEVVEPLDYHLYGRGFDSQRVILNGLPKVVGFLGQLWFPPQTQR